MAQTSVKDYNNLLLNYNNLLPDYNNHQDYVATFLVVLIMELMPYIKLCVIYKHGAITYKTR